MRNDARASRDVAHLSAFFPVIGDGQNDNRKLIENIFDKAKIHVNFADKKRKCKRLFLFVCKMYYEQVLNIALILAKVKEGELTRSMWDRLKRTAKRVPALIILCHK